MHQTYRIMDHVRYLLLYILIMHSFTPSMYAETYPDDFPCFDSSWTYLKSGQCFKRWGNNEKLDFDASRTACKEFLGQFSDIKVILPEIANTFQMESLKSYLLNAAMKEKIWLNARRSGPNKPFLWEDDTPAHFDFLSWSGGTGTGNCLVFFFTNQRVKATWESVPTIENVECDSTHAVICSHSVKSCENPPGGFVKERMIFTPTQPYVGSITTVKCAQGYFEKPSNAAAVVTDSTVTGRLDKFEYLCTGRRANSGPSNPLEYTPQFAWSGHNLFQCLEMTCELKPSDLCNAEPGTMKPENQTTFKFNEEVKFTCEKAFVSYENATSKDSFMTCRSQPDNPKQGMWVPLRCQACVAIRCDQSELENMAPVHGHLSGARNKITGEEYGQLQVKQFNKYQNVVGIKCNEAKFFDDRSFEKFVECSLDPHEDNKGVWIGYGGTLMPLLKVCKDVTCMYEDILMKPQYKLNLDFEISFSNDTVIQTKHLEPIAYPYRTTVKYTCMEGYETVTQDSVQKIVCGTIGKWRPQLAGCLQKSVNFSTGSTGRYIPPALEAPSADQLGAVVVSIIIVFLVALLLLDLATLRRDITWLYNNIKLQKRLWSAKRRVKQEKKMAEMNK